MCTYLVTTQVTIIKEPPVLAYAYDSESRSYKPQNARLCVIYVDFVHVAL